MTFYASQYAYLRTSRSGNDRHDRKQFYHIVFIDTGYPGFSVVFAGK